MTQQDIFTAALQITDPDARSAYLAQACGSEAERRRRVEILLQTHESAGDFLARPALEQLAGNPSPTPGRPQDVAQPDEAAEDEGLGFLQPSSTPGALGRLGHYEVLEVLGRGGFGIVFKALDERLQRLVALKVLAPALAATSPPRRRFLREARASAAVRHENVVAIHDVEEQPLPYLVMEYVNGETLQQRLDRVGPLDVPAVLRIGRQVASGLAAAHALGLIHRDIKPANILLENGSDRVKISDFGLARTADDASLSQSGYIAGTPLYMAPEQARGETIDQRADLFSLGSVLYVMCSGRPPFRASSTLAVLKRVAEDTPRPIREIIPEVPEWLCAIIARLHAKEPHERFASAQEVADLLARSLSELPQRGSIAAPAAEPPVVAPSPDPAPTATRESPGPAPAFRPPLPRRRLWAAAAAGLLLLFAGLCLGEATGVTDVRGTIIRLFAPEGTLVVEVDDPGVSVTIDGGEMVITGAGAREIRLKTGQYKVQASKDGKVVRQELVAVTRNGRQVVRVSKEVEPTEAGRWERSVARLPAEKQVKAVVLRLKDLNPGFDGKVAPTIEHGVVTELRFKTDEVEDISPLRVLRGLVTLECPGTFHKKGKLSDLTPLCGLRLTYLRCAENPIADLSPLRGMPLTTLHAGNTQVSDLSPLQGMRLKALTLQGTGVKDLSPLRGMPLTWLDLYHLRGVSDLSPLQGMPLEYLNLTALPVTDLSVLASLKSLRRLLLESMPVSDLTPLHGLSLKDLNFKGTQVTDLSPIKGLPLLKLGLDYQAAHEEFVRSFKGLETINDKPAADFWKKNDGAAAWEKSVAALPPEQQVEAVARQLKELNPGLGQVKSDIRDGHVMGLAFYTHAVTDLSPLRALPRLESLGCGGTVESQGKLTDLSPLRGLPLKTLSCEDNPVSDLSPLRGMPLEVLRCYRTPVEDLSPLKGMPLTRLSVASTRVTDLSPLKGMKLTTLWCDKTLVTDLAPLRGMALTGLDVSYSGVSDLSPLKGMPLIALALGHTPVSDLSPLKGMPLTSLDLLGAKVTDLSPLKGMQLKELRCDFQRERDAALLRSLTTLERINDKPAADFWKEVGGQ